jgi:hypothetical protein
MNETNLLWGLLFGSVGLGFFVYGRRQKAVVPFLCGLGLMGLSLLCRQPDSAGGNRVGSGRDSVLHPALKPKAMPAVGHDSAAGS